MDIISQTPDCKHYKRKCKIRSPCCNEIFGCQHCHNETMNSLEVAPAHRHDLLMDEVEKVICSVCSTEQHVQQNCTICGICMGNYFCAKCKFFDDDVSKNQYHCDECGLCRIGGKENFFHCNKCGCCYSKRIKDTHHCIERAMHHNCPICFEFLFGSLREITALPCAHTIHLDCLKEMKSHFMFACPVCLKSICDMSEAWEKLDNEVASTPMPEFFKKKMVWILCNDCGDTSEVNYNTVAHKCQGCKSYNTRRI